MRRTLRRVRSTFVATIRQGIERIRQLGHAARRVARQALPFAAIAALMLVMGGAAAYLYGLYGFHPEVATARWAALQPNYAVATGCRACHAHESTAVSGAVHRTVACESCHGPLAAHAAGGSEVVARPAAPLPPASACITCHEKVDARPISFPVVDLNTHFRGPSCLACHDPHTALSPTPPKIPHPLARLPACLTCHGADGMKPVPASHPVWSGSCFTCHASRPT